MIRLLAVLFCVWAPAVSSAQPGGAPLPRPRAETLARACSGCHAERKNGEGLIPPLNGKPQAELIQTMRDFKTGRRVSSIMNRIAKGYEEADFVAMAEYFAGR